MATIDDIIVTPDEWLDVNDATSIAIGVKLRVQSKGQYLLCQIAATQPDADDSNGVVIEPMLIYPILDGTNAVWLKAVSKPSPVNVQEG